MITELLTNPYLLHAMLAGLALTAITGPLGCFVVWRRMAYFGDTMAHASLLGVALALMTNVSLTAGIFMVAALLAVLVTWFTRDARIQADTMLGILAHGMLALSLVIVSLAVPTRVDLMRFLFGDILALGADDVWRVAAIAVALLIVLLFNWRKMLIITIHPDIASVEGVRVDRLRLLLMLLLAAVVAAAIQLVGILLITALLIIPAAAARFWSRTPQCMAWLACLIGMASVSLGLCLAYENDLPAAPAIVVAALGIFCMSWLTKRA